MAHSTNVLDQSDDPLTVFQATLEELPRLIDGLTDDELDRAPTSGAWSPLQVLNHLADAELVVGVRVRMVLTQDRPPLVATDQEAWATRLSGLDASARETLERWAMLRRTNLRVYASLTPAELERIGIHSERGDESLRTILHFYAEHDREHLDQLRRGLQGERDDRHPAA